MSFHDPQYSEKRDYLRMKVGTPAVLRLAASGDCMDVSCQDLSSQGAQLVTEQALEPGTLVELSIPSPTPGLQGLEGKGSVVRCVEHETGGYSIGLRFDSLA
jgi:hypothetical protein